MTDLKLYGYKQYFDELSNIHLNKKLPNKIIFSGRKGIGKCYFVNHFINFILSINEEYSYDSNNNLISQKNKSFNLVKNNSHPNFYKIKKEDGKKNIDISQIRNLYDFVNRSSFNNKLKIVLIEDIENLSINSSNALLKLIEEPNKNVQYFLIHDISKHVIDTIKSRCINYNLILDNNYKKSIIDHYFGQNIYDNLPNDLKNHFLTPGDIISLINLIISLKLDIENFDIETFLNHLIKDNIYKNKQVSINSIKILIEMLFSSRYKDSKNENLLRLSRYFNKKFSEVMNFNLVLEIFFLEFKSKIINAK